MKKPDEQSDSSMWPPDEHWQNVRWVPEARYHGTGLSRIPITWCFRVMYDDHVN